MESSCKGIDGRTRKRWFVNAKPMDSKGGNANGMAGRRGGTNGKSGRIAMDVPALAVMSCRRGVGQTGFSF